MEFNLDANKDSNCIKVMSFYERRYIGQSIHIFAVPQYLGLIVWLLSILKQTGQPQIWGTLLWQYLYRLEEIDMTVK